jgi:two-component system, LuxR family, sensor kinase FixL
LPQATGVLAGNHSQAGSVPMSQLLARIGLAPDAHAWRLPQVAWNVLLVSAGYYAGGIVGILLGFPPSGIAAIWPSTAILLAALLLTPPRHWWIYLLAAVPTHLHLVANFQRPEVPFGVMLCQVASNAVHAVLAALAVRFVIGAPPRFDSLRNMAAFILLAGIMATAVACVLAVSLFLLTGWATDFWLAWRQRVLANVFAMITIPPVIVLTFAGRLVGAQDAPWRSYAELGLLTMGLLAVGMPVFGSEFPALAHVPTLLLAPLPFLLWAAVRLGAGGLSLSLLVVAAVSLTSGYVGRGPFATGSPAENVLSLQVFLIAISIPLLLLAALVEERRRAEESLKQTEARMAVAAASTDTGLWQYDLPMGHLWATEHCRSMFGLDANTPLTPEAFLGAVHPDDRAAASAAMRVAASAAETARRIEFRVNHPSGQRWYLATANTEFDAHGEPIRVSGIFRDITPRRKAEQEAEQLEDALRATRRELARVSRQTTIGAMAASIAHEINQPLTAIVANANAGLRLLARGDSSEVQAALKRIVGDGLRAGQAVAGVRAIFGKDGRKKSSVSINELVREVLALAGGELESQRVSLQVELHRDLPRVTADRVQLQQVLLNLIMNAVEAMSSVANRERSLLVRSELHGARDVLIAVEDSGPGINPNDMDRIFDAFFTTKSHGMGLGLSICKSIIESHGGRLWASTRNPHGSVFYIQLPCEVPNSPPSPTTGGRDVRLKKASR